MRYNKAFLSYDEQAELLIKRGLIANKAMLIQKLHAINYYRLSGYLYPYRENDDLFKPGTTFEPIWKQYLFDRRLRLACLDAIERVEIAVRTQLAFRHAEIHGPFGYTSPINLPNISRVDFDRWQSEIEREFQQSGESFARHFRDRYGPDEPNPPIWMIVEVMTLGKTITFFRGVDAHLQAAVAGEYGLPDRVFGSWLRTLNEVRNVCAHHGRLWNRDLGNNPLLPNPRKYPSWHEPARVPQNKLFVVILMLRHCLRVVAPTSAWPRRFETLVSEFPEVPLAWMGFPKNWKEHPLWR